MASFFILERANISSVKLKLLTNTKYEISIVSIAKSFFLLQQSPFYQPANAMVKVMSMTAGDFEFDEIFRMSLSGEEENAGTIPFPPISYLLWIIFVIIMPILFINMLVNIPAMFYYEYMCG